MRCSVKKIDPYCSVHVKARRLWQCDGPVSRRGPRRRMTLDNAAFGFLAVNYKRQVKVGLMHDGQLPRQRVITADRPAYAGTEGCFGLLVFFLSFFI